MSFVEILLIKNVASADIAKLKKIIPATILYASMFLLSMLRHLEN